MRWIDFRVCKPSGKRQLITRAIHPVLEGDLLQEWPEWLASNYSPALTHWWDGEYDLRIASTAWRLLYSDRINGKDKTPQNHAYVPNEKGNG